MKIGIYGGTFNPPHLGHLTAAAAVIATLKLDKLLLIPASIPPHKDLPAGSATAEQRLEMTRMAGEHLGLGSKVETLDMEVRRAGKSFTSDTLAELKAQFPEDELWLLMGTDMFLSFETWHEPEKIASLAGIAAFGRTKADMEPQFSAQRDKLYRLYPDARIFTLTVPGVIDISSTELREQLASGTGENLLPPAVYGYILRNHLYGTDVNLKSLTLSQLRPVALSYLKYKRIPHVLGTEQEAIRLATRYGADVEIAELADPDQSKIAAIDVSADIQTALENSYAYRLTRKQLTNARTDTVKEKLTETEKNQKETISNSVKSAYDSLLLAQSGYEQAQSALALQEVSMKSADAKLAAGTITKNTYENQKASYTTAQVTAQTQKLSLLQAMNDYDWAVNGLASVE